MGAVETKFPAFSFVPGNLVVLLLVSRLHSAPQEDRSEEDLCPAPVVRGADQGLEPYEQPDRFSVRGISSLYCALKFASWTKGYET